MGRIFKIAIRRVGKSLGIALPTTIVENYRLSIGDELYPVEREEGVVVTPIDPKFQKWARAYERTNKRYRFTLKALAKQFLFGSSVG
jgi:antitoxin component of MazEF toxin-antitoxin module